MEFFDYEHIKVVVVYSVFGYMTAISVLGYGYWIVSGIRWIVKNLKKRFDKEETANE